MQMEFILECLFKHLDFSITASDVQVFMAAPILTTTSTWGIRWLYNIGMKALYIMYVL